jgi:hypothetical protein
MEKTQSRTSIHPAVLSNRENTLRCLQGIFLKSPFSASKKRHFCHEGKASCEPGMKKSLGSVPVPTFTVVPERITSKPLRILIFLDYKKFLSLFFVYMQINPFITTKIWIFCLF